MSTPSRLGRYPVRRRIGAGAFATVWLAHDEQLDCDVAVKVLADNRAADHPGVIVERVVQVTDDRLRWVQVRSDDRATADRVLGSVRTRGL